MSLWRWHYCKILLFYHKNQSSRIMKYIFTTTTHPLHVTSIYFIHYIIMELYFWWLKRNVIFLYVKLWYEIWCWNKMPYFTCNWLSDYLFLRYCVVYYCVSFCKRKQQLCIDICLYSFCVLTISNTLHLTRIDFRNFFFFYFDEERWNEIIIRLY